MQKSILVIDDEEILRKTFVRLFDIEGYDTFACASGQEALVLLSEKSFDLIICDIRMPGMDGFTTVNKLEQRCLELGITCPPVIFISGCLDESIELKVVSQFEAPLLWKPFGALQLLYVVRKMLETNKMGEYRLSKIA